MFSNSLVDSLSTSIVTFVDVWLIYLTPLGFLIVGVYFFVESSPVTSTSTSIFLIFESVSSSPYIVTLSTLEVILLIA